MSARNDLPWGTNVTARCGLRVCKDDAVRQKQNTVCFFYRTILHALSVLSLDSPAGLTVITVRVDSASTKFVTRDRSRGRNLWLSSRQSSMMFRISLRLYFWSPACNETKQVHLCGVISRAFIMDHDEPDMSYLQSLNPAQLLGQSDHQSTPQTNRPLNDFFVLQR